VFDPLTGQISVVGDLDYERIQKMTFVVTAQDSGSPYLTATKEVVLNILDANDNTPEFLVTSYTIEIFEQASIGTSVLQLRADDDDLSANLGGISGYFISGGDGGNTFSIDNNGIIRLAQPLNFDVRQTYRLEIKARDNAPFGQQRESVTPVNVVINVRDYQENDPAFILNTYIATVKENIAINTGIIKVNATPGEPGPLSYSIIDQANVNTDGNSFRIEATSGEIFRRLGFDYETKQFYTFKVMVTNTVNSKTDSATVIVRILDINDNTPTFSPLQTSPRRQSSVPL
jgi:hypothetical protein